MRAPPSEQLDDVVLRMRRRRCARIRRAAKRFADAQEGHSWMGGGDPADMPYWEAELKAARDNLNRVIMQEVA